MVGQSEYSLMPARISGSCRTSTVSYGMPRRSRMATARLENPHCGKSAVPFMNRTTSFLLTMSAMRLEESGVDESLTLNSPVEALPFRAAVREAHPRPGHEAPHTRPDAA